MTSTSTTAERREGGWAGLVVLNGATAWETPRLYQWSVRAIHEADRAARRMEGRQR